jgi:hypothetical protein
MKKLLKKKQTHKQTHERFLTYVWGQGSCGSTRRQAVGRGVHGPVDGAISSTAHTAPTASPAFG